MNTSSRFAVAIHTLTALAYVVIRGLDKCLTSEFIAESANTNPGVIRRILCRLRQAGLVESQPGAGGGTRLARSAARITLLEIYHAVEDGPLFHLHYRTPNQACPIGYNIQSAIQGSLDQAEAAMEESLADTTLAQIVSQIRTDTPIPEVVKALPNS